MKIITKPFLTSLVWAVLVLSSCNTKKDSKTEGGNSPETEKGKTNLEKIENANPLITIDKKDSVGKKIDNGKKKLYLTFDDGPNQGTRVVMDILKAEKVPATFYMIGLHRYGSPVQEKLWAEVNKEPSFEVTNHSFTHAYRNQFPKFYADVNGAVNDFVRNHDSLKFNNKIVRAPGSNVWRLDGTYIDHKLQQRTKIMDSLYKLGYYITGWDWEWTYAGKTQKARQTPDQLIGELNGMFATPKLLNKPNHLVLLTHDLVYADSTDKAWLKEFIVKLKADPQIEFRVISQYPGAEGAFK
jgi:peptidoglycan-N-acetylglucosamine deacetylase